eukprot:1822802-Rhodomonas_salina.2
MLVDPVLGAFELENVSRTRSEYVIESDTLESMMPAETETLRLEPEPLEAWQRMADADVQDVLSQAEPNSLSIGETTNPENPLPRTVTYLAPVAGMFAADRLLTLFTSNESTVDRLPTVCPIVVANRKL